MASIRSKMRKRFGMQGGDACCGVEVREKADDGDDEFDESDVETRRAASDSE